MTRLRRRMRMVPAPAALALAALVLAGATGPVMARTTTCTTSIGGQMLTADYESGDAGLQENRSYRERLFGGHGRITCPGYVTLRLMTPGLSDREREPFCLQYDGKAQSFAGFQVGPRDAYVGCRKPSLSFCARVNAGREAAMKVARIGTGLITGGPADGAGGLSAIARTSGAVILSGPRSTISESLVALGSQGLAAVTAPAALPATALTVVAVGGALYACAE